MREINGIFLLLVNAEGIFLASVIKLSENKISRRSLNLDIIHIYKIKAEQQQAFA
jgi:hypothetical protein